MNMIDPDYKYEYENNFDYEAESRGYVKLCDLPDLDMVAQSVKVLSHYKEQMPASCQLAVDVLMKELAVWV